MSEAKPKDESGPRTERALRVLLPIAVLGLGVVLWGAVVRWRDIPPYVLPGPELVFSTLVADWGDAVGVARRHAHHHAAGLCACRGRRRRARGAVQPVAPDRIFALSLRGDPAGDADRGDRAAAAGLPAAAGGGARLRLDRRLLPRARQHDARPQLGRSQPRRPVPPLRRHALAGAVGAQAAGGAALHPGRPEDRGRAVPDRRGRCRDRGRLGRRRLRARLPYRRGRLSAQHSRACSRRCCCSRSPGSSSSSRWRSSPICCCGAGTRAPSRGRSERSPGCGAPRLAMGAVPHAG